MSEPRIYEPPTIYDLSNIYATAGGGGGGGVPVEYWQLEYFEISRDIGGANFVINLPAFNNKDKNIQLIFEINKYIENSERRIFYIGKNNNSSPGVMLSYNLRNLSQQEIYSRNNFNDYTTPRLYVNLDSYKVKFDIQNATFNLETGAGTVINSTTNYSESSGLNRLFLFTDRTTPGENYQPYGKFYSLIIQDVCNMIPVKRKGDNVIGVFDLVSNTFYTPNYGGSNIIAGPIVL